MAATFSVMVDSGASGHYFDDALIPRLRYRLENYQELAIRRYITTAGGHQLEGAGQGLLRGHIIDAKGVQRLIQISVLIVPGLGRNLSSVKQASRNGVVSIFDKYNPRLEANNFTLLLQELENDLYFFVVGPCQWEQRAGARNASGGYPHPLASADGAPQPEESGPPEKAGLHRSNGTIHA